MTRRIYGNQVDQPIARLDSNGTSWYHQDVRGSVVALSNTSGTVQTQYAYDGFGNSTVTGSTSFADAYRYTGRFFDISTGLQYNRARWYDPKTGRWITQDPIGFAAGDANLYRYAGNGQPNRTDPSGYFDDDLFWFNVIALGGEDAYNWFRQNGGVLVQGDFLLNAYGRWEKRNGSYAAVIYLEEDYDAVEAALAFIRTIKQATWLGFKSDFDLANLPAPNGVIDALAFQGHQARCLADGASAASAFASLYLSGLGLVNEGTDWVLTTDEVLQGNLIAALGYLPFVPGSVFKVVGKGGKVLIELTQAEVLRLVRSQKNLIANLAQAGFHVKNGFAAHHLIPVKFNDMEILMIASKAGYDINRANNGIMLPTTKALAKKHNLPLHSGGHLKGYYDDIHDRLIALSTRYKRSLDNGKPWSNSRLLRELQEVENGIRRDLLNPKHPLQCNSMN